MRYRRLGRTGLEVSEIGYGCEWIEKKSAAEIAEITDRCRTHGINVLDCWMSNPHVRSSLGDAIAQDRDRWIVQGHIGSTWQDEQYVRTRDVEACKVAFDDMLARFRTDHVELGMIHYVDSPEEMRTILAGGPYLDYVLDLKAHGVIGHVGYSTHNPETGLMAIESGELKLEDYKLDQWRLMHIGAQPVPKSLIRRWKQIFPHHDYDTNYGLSESTGPGCVHLGLENIDHVGAIGVPGYRWECKVCSDQQGTEVPQGETGELWVKGPGVMRCYYNDPKATAETLHDGWLLTGDMARVDDDGFIWLVDRKKDVIIMGGENIYPVQIEDFLAGYPAIQDVAVIGIPDERLGEVSCAIIQLKPGHLDAEGNPTDITEQDIRDYCLDLPRYKRPRKIIFAPVPRNPTGKIEKPALRAKYGAENLVDRENQA